jgi:putative flavoprotein involved in K+ transport
MTGIDGGYDLAPRHLADQGAELIGRVLGVSDGVLSIADDATELLAAADRNHDRFIAAADAFAAGPSHDYEFQYEEPPASMPPTKVRRIDKLNLRTEDIGTIIWANGYGYSYDWVQLPVIDGSGVPIQTRGVTSCPGTYFLGLHWMHTFRSAILAFMGRDAAYIADHMDRLTSP